MSHLIPRNRVMREFLQCQSAQVLIPCHLNFLRWVLNHVGVFPQLSKLPLFCWLKAFDGDDKIHCMTRHAFIILRDCSRWKLRARLVKTQGAINLYNSRQYIFLFDGISCNNLSKKNISVPLLFFFFLKNMLKPHIPSQRLHNLKEFEEWALIDKRHRGKSSF